MENILSNFNMSTQHFTERRLTNKLMEYWDSIRGKRHHPAEEEIDPDMISDLWPNCFIVKVNIINGLPNYEFKYLGENIKNAYKQGHGINQGLSVDLSVPLVSHEISTMKDYLDELMEGLEPVIEEVEVMVSTDLMLKARQCFLPLGPNEEEIDHVVGAMTYKLFSSK